MMLRTPFRSGFGLSGAGVAVLSAPAAWEGPVLIEVAEGHAVALLDTFGIILLVCGSYVLYRALFYGCVAFRVQDQLSTTRPV